MKKIKAGHKKLKKYCEIFLKLYLLHLSTRKLGNAILKTIN